MMAAPAQNAAQGLGTFLPIILMFGILWIFMIMPQRKQQKARQAMLAGLKKGDKVITAGGIHGEITELDEEEAKVRIADKVEIRVNRAAISKVKGE
ncbi:MAG TPA: preprotein translocase subunit YajC [Bacillota bacterium]|jgi:preprotein translocase subunit YajC|nr:preprotein translocase subunit YajC [Bacillota bacterium]